MKRSGDDLVMTNDIKKLKKIKHEDESAVVENITSVLTDENLLYEILKHSDARTLGSAACINKQWHKTTQDERLWELICTKQWTNVGCSMQQLRSVVLALGGFRRLYAHYLWPLGKPMKDKVGSPVIRSDWTCVSASVVKAKDEMNLSMSTRYYEKMNFKNP